MRVYREEGSTFSSEGKVYDLNTLFLLTQDTMNQLIKVSELTWVLAHDTPRRERVQRADVTVPILVTKLGKLELVIAGLHRLQKAVELGLKELPYKRVSPEMLKMAEIRKPIKRVNG